MLSQTRPGNGTNWPAKILHDMAADCSVAGSVYAPLARPSREEMFGLPRATEHTPTIHYAARVKGGRRAFCFFCGGSPFFKPQKNQKNTPNCAKIVQGIRAGHLGE
jgi:hypothetical protein